MFQIDECPNDEERGEDPVRNCYLPGKALPDRHEQQRSDQFHREIAKGDFCAAIRTATAEQNPADQRQVLTPGNRLFAGRAKRATRFINRKIDRPAINADVQKRPDRRAKNKREQTKERFVNTVLQARSDITARFGIATLKRIQVSPGEIFAVVVRIDNILRGSDCSPPRNSACGSRTSSLRLRQFRQNRLLHVKPIFRLVKNGLRVLFQGFFVNFLAPVGW